MIRPDCWSVIEESRLTHQLRFWLQLLPQARVVVVVGEGHRSLWTALGLLDHRPVLFLGGQCNAFERNQLVQYLETGAGGCDADHALTQVPAKAPPPPTTESFSARLKDLVRREGVRGLRTRFEERIWNPLEQIVRERLRYARSIPSDWNRVALATLQPESLETSGPPQEMVHWVEATRFGKDWKRALFMHPETRQTYLVSVDSKMVFTALVNLREDAWDKNKGGVVFTVRAAPTDQELPEISASCSSDPSRRSSHRNGQELRLDLSRFTGREVRLTLETRARLPGQSAYAWAVWGNPWLCAPRPLASRSRTAADGGSMARARLQRFLARKGLGLTMPVPSETPVVSILIAAYNRADLLLECLESLALYADVPMEVIVVDDCSTDATPELLAQVGSVIHERNPSNLHYLRTCNRGARLARGRYLLLLNQDVRMTPGSLKALVETLELHPDAGAVGGQLLRPDGRIQEAGGIVWNDGSATHYGSGDDPEAGELSYLREVDYCSGACLLVRRQLFEQLGGYDERYTLAYYEDADLAFELRRLGYRVLYQPRSSVFHQEWSSTGKRTAAELCLRNRPKFQEKWAEELQRHPPSGQLLAGRDRRTGRRILIVEERIPDPTIGGGLPRALAIQRALVASGALVTLLPHVEQMQYQPITGELQQLGVEVLYGVPTSGGTWLEEVCEKRAGHYDTVVACRPLTARCCEPLFSKYFPGARRLYDTESLHCEREILAAEVAGSPLSEARQAELRAAELDPLSFYDIVIAVSEPERALIRARHPGLRVTCIGHPAEPRMDTPGFEQRSGILFVGGFLHGHPPNTDAVKHFVAHVLPAIRRQLPEDPPLRGAAAGVTKARFTIAGSHPGPEILALAGDGVEVTGYVEDLSELYARHRVFVAPLRFCSGIPLKVVEALGQGLPVVATRPGARGLELIEGVEAVVVDDDQSFADAVVDLLTRQATWDKLHRGALDYVARACSPERFRQRVQSAFALPLGAAVFSEGPGARTPEGPLVSVCVPCFNGARFLAEALDSAIRQTYTNMEILVSDDGSDDASLAIARSMLENSGVPHRILAGPRRGMVANWNYCSSQATGKYIKFLFQDDLLAPRCLSRLVEVAEQDDRVGLVFSPRTLLLDGPAIDDPICRSVVRFASDVHLGWSSLSALQPGQALLGDPALLDGCLNKVGEPSTVLLRRALLERVGPFDESLCQIVDLDMWFRLMAEGHVGFVEETLSVFRIHLKQATRMNLRAGEHWNDTCRLYEKLGSGPLATYLHPEVRIKVAKLQEGSPA